MITKIRIRNFKKLKDISFDLQNSVVLVGPNNSGKTTILQALTLLDLGLKKLSENKHRQGKQRSGVAINRRDMLAMPVSSSKYIWYHQLVREIDRSQESQKTSNILIEIFAEGITNGIRWEVALEFDYANPESIYCRPLKKEGSEERFKIDNQKYQITLAFLQPMSGIATIEDKLTPGSIDVRIGEGKTADVLRNICYQLLDSDDSEKYWNELSSIIEVKFGAKLNKPVFIPETGKIEMTYQEDGRTYDLASAGRGFQQTLLLLSYLFSYPGRTLLLDEPDAHLEVIRQRETYEMLTVIARKLDSQLIIASHSEVVLNQAAENDTVIAMFDQNCQPLINKQQISQFRKLLTEIGWDKYYLAKSKKHIIYLEGATDYRIMLAFARKIKHPVLNLFEKANVFYTANNVPKHAQSNFHGLKGIIPELKGIAIFDRLEKETTDEYLKIFQWRKRELENYFSFPEVLTRWAANQADKLYGGPVFASHLIEKMTECIQENTAPINLKDRNSSWWINCKMSDDYLPFIFESFYKKIERSDNFNKGRFYELVNFLDVKEIDQEIIDKLDSILEILI